MSFEWDTWPALGDPETVALCDIVILNLVSEGCLRLRYIVI